MAVGMPKGKNFDLVLSSMKMSAVYVPLNNQWIQYYILPIEQEGSGKQT
jgi:hypothetical protein